LARGNALGRDEAERSAIAYYAQLPRDLEPNDQLDPRRIRDWVEASRSRTTTERETRTFNLRVELEREPTNYLQDRLVVAPIDRGERVDWIDAAGYAVAHGTRPENWPSVTNNFLFELYVSRSEVIGEQYLPHR
jgi:hypothetical protein